MRKIIKFVIIPLIIIILVLGTLLYFKYNTKDVNIDVKNLKGEKISDKVYGYKFNTDSKKNILFSMPYKDYVYYALTDGDDVYFYRYDIYTLENKLLSDSFKYMGCNVNDDKLYCYDNIKNDILDLDLKLIKSDIGDNVIPINKSYYSIKGTDLYKDDEVIYKFDSNKYKNYDYFDYQLIGNDIYLFYFEYDNSKYMVCDIKNNNCESIPSNLYTKYSNGIYFVNEKNIEIYDLVNNNKTKYDISIDRSKYFNNYIYKDNLYVYNEDLKRVEIIDYKNNKVSYIDIENASTITYYDKYLYIYSYSGKYDYYIIDINSYNFNYQTIQEYISSFDKILSDKINNIKEKYNVNIHIKDDILDFPDFTAKKYSNSVHIISSLDEITKVFDKMSKELFDSFYDDNYNGLHMYLTSTLKPKDLKTQYSDPAAYSLVYKNQYIIVMNIEILATETNTCHELMHNIENNLRNKGELLGKWYDLNPRNHTYTYSYKKTDNTKYTIGESDINNVYFIDSYANSFPTEDMARVFENVCNTDKDSLVNEYPNLYKKADYLREILYKYYPSLKESTIFNSLKQS